MDVFPFQQLLLLDNWLFLVVCMFFIWIGRSMSLAVNE